MIGRDRRQLFVIAVVALFMVVTVGHVASYTGSFEPAGWQWLGILYALAVDASIGVCAWLTRWKTTRLIALVAYVVFTLADGVFNVAHIQPWTTAVPFAAWVYALFPTAAQALLGLVARNTDILAERSANARKPRKAKTQIAQPAPQPVAAIAGDNGHQSHACPYCARKFAKSQGVSAHLKHCDAYLAHKAQGVAQ